MGSHPACPPLAVQATPIAPLAHGMEKINLISCVVGSKGDPREALRLKTQPSCFSPSPSLSGKLLLLCGSLGDSALAGQAPGQSRAGSAGCSHNAEGAGRSCSHHRHACTDPSPSGASGPAAHSVRSGLRWEMVWSQPLVTSLMFKCSDDFRLGRIVKVVEFRHALHHLPLTLPSCTSTALQSE